MQPRDCLITALEGGVPDVTPYSVYDYYVDDINNDKWKLLLDKGLLVTNAAITVKHIEHGVISSEKTITSGGDTYKIFIKETPVGKIQRVLRNNWYHEFWIKSQKDYKVMQWIVEHTEVLPDYDRFYIKQQEVGEYGITCICQADHPRSPLMLINVDWSGTEQFCMDIALEVPELFELYEATKKLFLKEIAIIAAGPGRYVKWLENLTIDTLGPSRYSDFIVNVYNEAVPQLEAGGKRVLVHYDGRLRVIDDLIASSPVHAIESLTEPPEGDMMYDDCRLKWPNKVLWANINLGLYSESPQKLRNEIIAKRNRLGKRGTAFEISEGFPDNWKMSIPLVLDTLRELC